MMTALIGPNIAIDIDTNGSPPSGAELRYLGVAVKMVKEISISAVSPTGCTLGVSLLRIEGDPYPEDAAMIAELEGLGFSVDVSFIPNLLG